MLKTYVEFSYPGLLFPETGVVEVNERKIELKDVPERAFGYQFFDRQEITSEGELLIGQAQNKSKRFLIGKPYTNDQLAKLYGQDPTKRTLLFNLRQYPQGGILCRTGNWQPVDDNIEVIEQEVELIE